MCVKPGIARLLLVLDSPKCHILLRNVISVPSVVVVKVNPRDRA
jgi:hypothetical protein